MEKREWYFAGGWNWPLIAALLFTAAFWTAAYQAFA